MVESQHGDIELVWLEQLGADLRARTQAEYLYTAAAVAAFGGVCWGVAAQQNCCLGYVAVLAIGLLTLVKDYLTRIGALTPPPANRTTSGPMSGAARRARPPADCPRAAGCER